MKKTAAGVLTLPSAELATLKLELETNDDALFEEMSAHLFSRLLDDISVTVSKTGSQFGADAGTAGLRGRRLRLECKRYRETTKLDPRGLAGEVMEAVAKDPLIETWILMSTKKVKETERNLALVAGEKLGVPILVFDWTMPAAGAGICSLAALCATWPEVVERHMGKKAADAARALAPYAGAAVENLRKDLEFWNIGFRSLRASSIKQLERVWKDRAESRAALNQDAAGGRSGLHLISRVCPLQQLKDWWQTTATIKSPAVLTGLEGVGKTWVALDWANKSIDELPIIVLVPASVFANGYYVSEAGLRELLVKHLRAASNSNLSDEYWQARMNNLLQRPATEGAAILLIVDGLNQQPHVTWSALAQTVQGDALAGRVRLLATTRRTYFEVDLRRFAVLDPKPSQVAVGPYDQAELDEILWHHGMTRADMHPALIKLASVPRLFPLVYRLKDNAALQSEASIHRLLFEYGRDVLQERQQSTLTEDSWVAWLVERAREYYQRIPQTKRLAQPETYPDVAKTVDSPHISREEVARRLSDVVDGGLFDMTSGVTSRFVLQEDAAILALALALLDTLSVLDSTDFDTIKAELERWLEPVAAIDQVTEVLRAALAVSSATQGTDGQAVVDSLLVTWMNAQNPTSSFDQDVKVFGDAFPRSMLAVIERSGGRSQVGALYFAVQSVRRLSTQRTDDWKAITERMKEWASWVLLPRPENVADPQHYAKRNHDQIIERIGTANPGTKVVLGAKLKLAYQHLGDAASAIPSILEGHDLPAFASVLQTAAIREALQVNGYSRCWPGLAWLALVGSTDEVRTRECLQQMAKDLLNLEPEPGVHPRLRNRVSALLLRLTGYEPSEIEARSIDERFGGGWDYEKDYLDKPGSSYFLLEHRHLQLVLEDANLKPAQRLEKLKPFLADPSVTLPSDLTTVIQGALDAETFEGIDDAGQFTIQENRYEGVEAVAARFLPTVHVETSRRRLQVLASRDGDQKYWSAYRAPQFLLVAGPAESEAFIGLRTRTNLSTHEQIANTWALQVELLHKSLEEQLAVLVSAECHYYTMDLMAVIRSATASQLLSFLEFNSTQTKKAERVVLEVMAYQLIEDADAVAEKLVVYLSDEDEALRTIAFVALSSCAPEVCGRKLLAINWKPNAGEPLIAHYGSYAVGLASQHFGFDEVLSIVAPWRWLDAAAARGNQASEFQTASKYLLGLIKSPNVELPELNAVVSMRVPAPGKLARLSVSERPKSNDGLEGLRQISDDVDEVNLRMQAFAKEAAASIQKIRSSGYSLYLHAFTKESVRNAYLVSRQDWEETLEGANTLAPDFVQRVRSAEGLFVAFCDVLLEVDPAKGAVLWRALRACVHTQIKGKAGISELVHMVFRAPASAEIRMLKDELASFAETSTDKALLDLVIVAQVNGQEAWLEELVKADTAAPQLWRRKRAIVLEAFQKYPDPEKLVWPEGESTGTWQALKERMAAWTNRGAFAQYWWGRFTAAATAEEAYCAWTVFLGCADRRAHIWMDSIMDKSDTGSELDRLRGLQVRLNRDLLERTLLKQEDKSPKLSEKLFSFDAPSQWFQLDGINS